MAFRDSLAALGAHRVRFVDTTSEPRPDLKDMIAGLCPGGVVYCCGPASPIELRQSGLSITVGPETTLLQAIRVAGVEIASDASRDVGGWPAAQSQANLCGRA